VDEVVGTHSCAGSNSHRPKPARYSGPAGPHVESAARVGGQKGGAFFLASSLRATQVPALAGRASWVSLGAEAGPEWTCGPSGVLYLAVQQGFRVVAQEFEL
jgi:hypothetical protein